MTKKIIIAILILLVIGKISIGSFFFGYNSPGPLEESKNIVITRGTGFLDISKQLEKEGVVENYLDIAAPAALLGKQKHFKHGEYEFYAHISPSAVINMLVDGDIIIRKLTVPEGLTSKEVLALVNAEEALSDEISDIPAEGSLLPETYHYERGESRANIIARMQLGMQKTLDKLWNQRADGLPFDTKEEAVILASIVEKEARLAEERTHVASVYINRLKKGMKLQADPTTIYAIELAQGKPMGRLLVRSDLKRDLKHNTYVYEGLPPTPIANPGYAAIEATLNPKQTDDIFFVARGDGGHYFARTYQEHKANIARYKESQQAQKESPSP